MEREVFTTKYICEQKIAKISMPSESKVIDIRSL